MRKDKDGLYKREGSPYWWASFTDSAGRRIRRSTETEDRAKASAIRARWINREGALSEGAVRLYTFEELAVDYLTEARTMKGRAKSRNSRERDITCTRSLRSHFAGYTLQPDGNAPLGARLLDGGAIVAYVAARRKAGVSDSTIRRDLSVLGAMLAYARAWWDWKVLDPTRGRKPVQGPHRVRWITEEEADRLIEAAGLEPKAPYLADWIRLALYTGMRKNELSGLRVEKINLSAGIILIEPADAKSRRRESVPINTEARAAILSRLNWRAKHCPDSPWLFCRMTGARVINVKKSFKSACERAGIADFSPHDLRHTCASWLAMRGVPIVTIKEILRHRNIATTMIYAHLSPEQARAGLDVLSAKAPMQKVSSL